MGWLIPAIPALGELRKEVYLVRGQPGEKCENSSLNNQKKIKKKKDGMVADTCCPAPGNWRQLGEQKFKARLSSTVSQRPDWATRYLV